mgnify:CR=1 FL=1
MAKNDARDARITKLREYLVKIIAEIAKSEDFKINANMLAIDVDSYSIDKMPVESTIETWITGERICRDVYSFRSRNSYSQDTINNLKNIGFFEQLEETIKEKNDKKELPDINGVEAIVCLSPGTMVSESSKTAEFEMMIGVEYLI